MGYSFVSLATEALRCLCFCTSLTLLGSISEDSATAEAFLGFSADSDPEREGEAVEEEGEGEEALLWKNYQVKWFPKPWRAKYPRNTRGSVVLGTRRSGWRYRLCFFPVH